MVQKYIIDKVDIPNLLTGKEIPLGQGSKARAFCVEIADEMTNWEVLKSIFPYAEIVGGDETLTAVRIDSNPKVGTPIVLYTEWLNAPYSTEPKVRDI